MNYYIVDLHLGHANAIGFDGRPFADVMEMNKTLIRRWNSTVGRADTVYGWAILFGRKSRCGPHGWSG